MNRGRRLVTLIAPAVVFFPNSVALRSAQHFDALDVDEIERRRRRPRVEDAVDIQADARLDAVVRQTEGRTHAANRDRRRLRGFDE